MIGSSKNNRENYPRKCFWAQEKETRVKFNPRLSANRPSNNWVQSNTTEWYEKKYVFSITLICIIPLQNVRLISGHDEANLPSLLPTKSIENKRSFFARIRLPDLCRYKNENIPCKAGDRQVSGSHFVTVTWGDLFWQEKISSSGKYCKLRKPRRKLNHHPAVKILTFCP